jgi:uncharacterized membrane protein HdeD (DUF308 family)
MTILLAKNWWAFVLRGVVAILLGVITFLSPGITFGALVLLFGAYALVDGVLSIAGAWRAHRSNERWGALLLGGLAGIVTAMITVAWPEITALALVLIVAAWALVTGVFEIVAAIRLRKYITGEWLLGLAGIASIVFGILIAMVPVAGALVIALWIGAYATVFGVMLVALGFRLRKFTRTLDAGSSMPLPV